MCSVFFEHASECADMLVPGAVNGCPVDAVIDTGSAATLLSEDFADRLPKELEKETSDQGPKLIGANGQPLEAVASAIVQLELGDATCWHRVRIVKGLPRDCIVGRDVLSHIPCTISSGQGRMFFSTSPASISTVGSDYGVLKLKSKVTKLVFDRLLKADLRLKPSKCFLFRTSVEFLGHIVTREGVRTDPGKIEKVRNWPTPEAVGEVRGFLGFCGYYRRLAQDFATIARPLYSLTKMAKCFCGPLTVKPLS